MSNLFFILKKWTVRLLIGAGIIIGSNACSNSNNDKSSASSAASGEKVKTSKRY